MSLADILKVEVDEDGTYIVTDKQTVVYGHGNTVWEALRDYIVSLIEYAMLLWRKTTDIDGETQRLWKRWFDKDGSPWAYRDNSLICCFFCGIEHPNHRVDCFYLQLAKLLGENPVVIEEEL